MKVSELTGAELDYWTARAEGIPAEQLDIRQVPRTDRLHVVRTVPATVLSESASWLVGAEVMRYSTDWAQGGPLIEKHCHALLRGFGAEWNASPVLDQWYSHGDTPLQTICRAVVRAAFGDEVDEAPIRTA